MLDKILPEDLRQKVLDSPAEARKEVFREVRIELYKRAAEFGEDLYKVFQEHSDLSYHDALEIVDNGEALSEVQKRLFFDVVYVADKDARHAHQAKEKVWANRGGIFDLAKAKGLLFAESSREEVLGVVFYFVLTGLWPKGKVILVDANRLAVELHVENGRDRVGLERPEDIEEREEKGEDTSQPVDLFAGLFRRSASAFGIGFSLVVTSGEGEFRELIEEHEHAHHVNSIVAEAFGGSNICEAYYLVCTSLSWIERCLTKGFINEAEAEILYGKSLRRYLPVVFDAAKDELLAGYYQRGDILEQVGDMMLDKTKYSGAHYDYIQALFSDERWEKLPEALKGLVFKTKDEYLQQMCHQVEVADIALGMVRIFGIGGGDRALEGLLQTKPLLEWESQIRKLYGSDEIDAYKEYRVLERKFLRVASDIELRHENPLYSRWIEIKNAFFENETGMVVKVEGGKSVCEVVTGAMSKLSVLGERIDKFEKEFENAL